MVIVEQLAAEFPGDEADENKRGRTGQSRHKVDSQQRFPELQFTSPASVALTVEDNGRGFDPHTQRLGAEDGLGLLSIQERVAALEALAHALLERETLDGPDAMKLFEQNGVELPGRMRIKA